MAMHLDSPKAVKELLEAKGFKPIRGLGQNFLVARNVVGKLVATAQITVEDTVLEIGPGIGVLTQEVAKLARRVVAVEKDARMISILQETLTDFDIVKLIHADALKLDTQPILHNSYKVVANLPYYITAPAIRKFLETKQQPESLTLIVQKEVAQRICAKPPNMSILAVSVQFYAAAKMVSSVKKTAFWPQPHVDSAIIHIVPHKEKPPVGSKKFFQIVKAGFAHPRKQLLGNLSAGLHLERKRVADILEKNHIKPAQRAETLSVQDWIKLAKAL